MKPTHRLLVLVSTTVMSVVLASVHLIRPRPAVVEVADLGHVEHDVAGSFERVMLDDVGSVALTEDALLQKQSTFLQKELENHGSEIAFTRIDRIRHYCKPKISSILKCRTPKVFERRTQFLEHTTCFCFIFAIKHRCRQI